jgi:AcrR family transcriptional regulator
VARRVTKDYEERRNEILNAAEKLFFSQGYEATPVESIIAAVNVSKGTFYYYFKSKEELLDALAQERAKKAFAYIDNEVFDNSLTAIERMKLYFDSSKSWKMDNREMLMALAKMLYDPANLILREKFMRQQLEMARPTLTRIIRQGVEEGVFHTPYPDDIAEMLFSIFGSAGAAFSTLASSADEHPENIDLLLHKFDVYQDLFERILGAPKGSIEFADKEYLRKYLLDT